MVIGLATSHETINSRELSAYEHSEAGFISGTFTRALIQPLDVLKIRFQLQEEPLKGSQCGKYTGVLQSIRLIYREEGVFAFWKGHIPAQGLSGVYGLVQFTTFEKVSHWIKPSAAFEGREKTADFLAGAIAGCTAMTAAMPMDVIRTRLVAQGEPKVYHSALHAVRKIWKYEKVAGFFRGISPSLTQIAPYTGLQFASYNLMMETWLLYIKQYESTGALVSGALAGTFAKTILYPLDLVRHRQQVNAHVRRGFGRTSLDKGMIQTFVGVMTREGFFGLFKGLVPSMFKAAANSGFSFLFYKMACDVLRAL